MEYRVIKMDSFTPATAIKPKDLQKNTEALKELLGYLDKPPRTVLDIRYGLGGWAKLVRKTYSKAKYLGYEADRETYRTAWKDKGVKLVNSVFPLCETKEVDLLLADFNTLTILKRGELDNVLASVRCDAVIFTDVCCSKIHLNYRSYGLRQANLSSYWQKFLIEGFYLVGFSKEHHVASTALFQRKSPLQGALVD